MLGFDFNDYTEATPPPLNTFQVCCAQEVSFHHKQETGTRWLKIVGSWSEFGNKRFYKSIFLPRGDGEEAEKKKEINKFLRNISAFGMGSEDIKSDMNEHDLAEELQGRYALGKVIEDRNGYLAPAFFKKLTDQQKEKYANTEEKVDYGKRYDTPAPAVNFGRSFKG
jgi:hypothetical protein